MFLQQEFWLILVGLLTAWVVKKNSGSAAPYTRIALFACIAALLVGEFGILAKGFAPTAAFFPTDIRGLLFTSIAAFLAAKFVVRSPKRATPKSRTKSNK